jgi:hypothetical protein
LYPLLPSLLSLRWPFVSILAEILLHKVLNQSMNCWPKP